MQTKPQATNAKTNTNKLIKIRKAVLTISTALFPFTFYYLSPAIPLQGSALGIVTGSLIIFAGLFVLSLFLGRTFCSWLCPAGGLQDQIAASRTAPVQRKKINWIKYLVWAVWLVGLFIFFREAGGIQGIEFAFATENGLSTTSVPALIVYGIVVLTFILTSLIFGRRAGCHTLCWISPFMVLGRRIGLALRIPSLHLGTNMETCVACKKCTQSCPMSIEVDALIHKGAIKNDDCILCGQCIQACHKSSIQWAWIQKNTKESKDGQ
jgi:ferredoxin-type protein NapH